MQYFPQLSTGAAGQYPLRRSQRRRVVVNTLADGSHTSYYDAAAGSVRWELPFQGLSDEEMLAIGDFFRDREGRLNSFTLLDPAANLLLWSEDFTKAAWTKDPLLSVSSGVTDPWGTSRATNVINGGGATQSVTQHVAAPGSYVYSLSVYARGSGPGVILLASSGTAGQRTPINLTSTWTRYTMPVRLEDSGEDLTFGFELPVGASADITGVQLEAQPSAGGYRRTTSRGGIYRNARFAMDILTQTSRGLADHVTALRIEAKTND